MRRRIALASGRAVAAVLFDKPEDQVSEAEAMAALETVGTEEDGDRKARALRAGWRAAAEVLNVGGLLSSALTGPLVDALDALDTGEALGMAKPSPSRRRKNAVERDEFERMLAFQVHFACGRWGVSKSRAVAIVTGVVQPSDGGKKPVIVDGRPYPTVEKPVLPMPQGIEFDRLRKAATRGEKKLGEAKLAAAHADGEAERDGRRLSTFAAFKVRAYSAQWADAKTRAMLWRRLGLV